MILDNWGPNDFKDKVAVRPLRVQMPTPHFNTASLTHADITDDRLRDAYRKMAEIISLQGDRGEAYLPIFARLHKEIQFRESNKSLLALAKEVASKSPTP